MLEVSELQVALGEGYHYCFKTPIFDETYDSSDGSNALLGTISRFAQESGLTETHRDTLETPRPHRQRGQWGPVMDWLLDVEYHHVVYACASVAALAAFLKNSIGIIKDWKDLSAKSRSVRILVRGKEVVIKDQMDINEVLRVIQDHLKNPTNTTTDDDRAPEAQDPYNLANSVRSTRRGW
jgi:hypothetical protein